MNAIEIEKQMTWLRERVLPGFENSNLPPSWKAESIRNTTQQIDDLEYLMETDPPRRAPQCGWKKSYRLHDANCKRCKVAERFEADEIETIEDED